MYKIMLIDDDEDLSLVLERYAQLEGYDFCYASDATTGLEVLQKERPDILLLDVMLPRINGFELCQTIREQGRRIPIIFLTAKGDMVDKKTGFKAGADDYVQKPFNTEELFLRIEAFLRRRSDVLSYARCTEHEGSVVIGDLKVCFPEYEVYRKDELLNLTSKEFEILALFAMNPGKVFTRGQICAHVWGEDDIGREESIPVYVRKIREKIEDNPSQPSYLLTVWRVGYKMASKV